MDQTATRTQSSKVISSFQGWSDIKRKEEKGIRNELENSK